MAVPSKASRKFAAGVPSPRLQRQIEEETAAFLAGGGEIQRIPRGVSGQPKLGGPQLAVAPDPDRSR